jgi:hypothetical protein
MTKHIADHRSAPTKGRLTNYLRIAREAVPGAGWQYLLRRPIPVLAGNRRVVEYARIERGREV